ncbi:MAG: glycosyltransferase [Oscillospiraceae bacterium]|nr:glycosyltransferase [Oscillospiraceae bacterium]
MKARIIEVVPEITLTVSMIVKNEEKDLPATLDALKPLLDSVSSELIITDTGSDDATVEIAKRYTDNVLYFDWINDFSAARNVGLKEAKGEWFMFLDADEIFDVDLSEMIQFFNDREMNRKYNSATYQLKDYTNLEQTTWLMFAASRIIKRSVLIRFVNPIHECFSAFPEPTYDFRTFATHTGYTYESIEEFEAKRQRNLTPLEQQAKEKSNDLRTLIQLFQEQTPEEKEFSLTRILSIARKNKFNDNFAGTAFLYAIKHYYGENDEKVIRIADEYIGRFLSEKTVLLLDVFAIKASALTKSGKIEEALEAYDNYFKYFDLYDEGKLDNRPATQIGLIFVDKTHRELLKTRYSELKMQTAGGNTQ